MPFLPTLQLAHPGGMQDHPMANFWITFRFTEKLQEWYREFLYVPVLAYPNVSILHAV